MLKNYLLLPLTFIITTLFFSGFSWADYSTHPEFQTFAQEMEQRYQFQDEELVHWFSQAEKQDTIIAAISKPAEQNKTWAASQQIFITPQRTERGI